MNDNQKLPGTARRTGTLHLNSLRLVSGIAVPNRENVDLELGRAARLRAIGAVVPQLRSDQ